MRDRALLLTAGAAMMVTQYVAVREIGASFFSTELVALASVAVTMVGPSVAYRLSPRLSERALLAWGLATFALQLALPVGLRGMVGWMAERGFEAAAMALTAVAASLFLCGFYAAFLPRVARNPLSLPTLYAVETVGAVVALLTLLLAPSWRVALAAGWGYAVVVLHLGFARRGVTVLAACAAAGMAFAYPRLDAASSAAYYRGYWAMLAPKLAATRYSPYHRVDVVDDGDERALFLDGVPFFRPGALEAFNVFIAELPGRLRAARGRALLIGSGSFQQAGMMKRLGYEVTVVELDAAVVDLGLANFQRVHQLQRGEIDVRVGDGRRFLENAPAASYDFIVVDVPAPFHIQTALLHTPRFYRTVASRLKPDGIASLNLSQYFDHPIARSIAAAAAEAFGEIAVVESGDLGRAHLYAGSHLPFQRADVDALLRPGERAYLDAEARGRLKGVAPLSEERLATVLWMARTALPRSRTAVTR